MNDTNPIPPTIADATRLRSLDPADQQPITGFFATAEVILRQPRRVVFQLHQSGAGGLIAALLVSGVLCSLIYGFVVGTFSGGTQLWAAPVKVAAGLLVAALICLPSLYIFSCLGGAQARRVGVR